MLRIGMLSGWHVHAEGYARELQAMSEVKIMAVYDEEACRGQAWAKKLEVPYHADLAEFLDRDDLDAVVVDAPTHLHPDVMIAAAQAGKHIFTEKVMALTVQECEAIADAVKKAGVKFCISFPARTQSKFLFAKRAIDEKLIGDVTHVRVRVAHNGSSAGWLPPHFYDAAACGGGAMMDLGAHPMYLARWMLGRPVRIASIFTYATKHPVEDNAVCAIEFENGAIGVTETSFVSSHSPDVLELNGTEGCLIAGGPDDTVRYRSNSQGDKAQEWATPSDLPPEQPRPIRQWVQSLLENRAMPFGLEDGTQLTELMEYAYIAHRERKAIDIPERKPVVGGE